MLLEYSSLCLCFRFRKHAHGAAQWAEPHCVLSAENGHQVGPVHYSHGAFWGHSPSRQRTVFSYQYWICLLNTLVSNHQNFYYLPSKGAS